MGIVSTLKPHVDRNGGNMAFVTLGDRTDQLEVTIFASIYRGDLAAGDIVHMQGQVTERGITAIDYEMQAALAAAAA